jgi:class 3 adenylate cyclase/tetratricopeptide (TPR) repeat protein
MLPRCAACGEAGLPAPSRFCLRCGAALPEAGEAARAEAGEAARAGAGESYTPGHLTKEVLVLRDTQAGERKEVTVLIADVAGSLAMAEALDPEDIHALMDGFFALALEAVHREGGTVNQFRGDGFMALFGAPRARGDDTARALRAALEVRERSRAYAESVRARFGLPFAVRIGVSTGLVWVGAIGNELRQDYTAEGPTVGLAARLEAAAASGQILVGDSTVRRCGAYFDLVDLGPQSLRGLAEPVRVHELVGEGVHRARLAVERARGLTPFSGREEALRLLRRALAATGAVRCVEVRGEVGVGKSRLVHECLARASRIGSVLELACRESSAERAYLPWLELLRRWPPGLPGAGEAAGLVDTLEGRNPSAAEPEAVAAAVRGLLGALLASGPLVVFLDDAHWLDPSSQALVGRLSADPPEGSLVFVATLRSDEAGEWGAAVPVDRIQLGALTPGESRRLAGPLLAGLADAGDLAELACLRGGGNPLFIEEVARALRDGPASARDAARLEVALGRARERIPETLHAVVASRVDALPPDAKSLLEVAAVLGEPFEPELLAEVEPGIAAEAAGHLALLVARGLVAPTANGEHDFCHGVVRSGAYAQLVRERRAALHRRLADVLAKQPRAASPDGASRIGHHYDRAGEPQAAGLHLLRAGRGYAELRALPEAVVHLQRAFALVQARATADPALAASVGLSLSAALATLDRSGEAAAVLEGLDVARAGAGDRLPLALAQVQAGWMRFSNEGEVARGRSLVARGLRLAESLEGAEDVRLLAHTFLSGIELLDGELESGLRAAQRVIELATARGDATSATVGRRNECAVYCEAGRLAEARKSAGEALRCARLAEGDVAFGMAQVALARVELLAGDVEGALAAAARADEAGERSGQIGLRYNAAVNRGYAHLLAGEPRMAQGAFEALAAYNDRWPSTWLHRARGRFEIGEADAAAELAARCLAGRPPRTIAVRALALRGLALGTRAGGRDEAEALLGEALTLCDALGLRPALAETHAFFAEVAARRGDAERAASCARRAIDEYARCGMALHADLARRLLSEAAS